MTRVYNKKTEYKMIKRNGDNVFAIASNQNNESSATRSAVSLCPVSTRIPQLRAARMTPPAAGKDNSPNLGIYVEKWKNRYEDAERKHKSCLLKAEKVKRDYDDLQRRHNCLIDERDHLYNELATREQELNRLRNVSERVFAEYQQLRNKHDVDAGVMHKVLQQAGEWYKQNKQLKRRSTALLQAIPNTIDIDITDASDAGSDTSSNEELEFLKRCVSELSSQVAQLQTELSAAKLGEFESQEVAVNLQQELENERELRVRHESELATLRSELERHERVSKLLLEEVGQLKNDAETDRERAETYKSEARSAKKRATVLIHQSSLLLGELTAEDRVLALLQELEQLKEQLEQQAMQHEQAVEELQLKLSEKLEETDVLLWEEKIKLAEEDARKAIQRAESAEKRLAAMEKPRSTLKSRISYFENGAPIAESSVTEIKKDVAATESSPPEVIPQTPSPPPPPPPPPPVSLVPPPPPPPPPLSLCPPPNAVAVFAGIDDMSTMLQNKHNTLKKCAPTSGGAIDAIVDQIKGGKFHLKSTSENFLEKKPKDEQPEAVKEMLTILGTLRKRRAGTRPTFTAANSIEGKS